MIQAVGFDALAQGDLPPLEGMEPGTRRVLTKLIESGLGSPLTSSAGRLFDAVSAIVGIRQAVRFEGQAAMELEFAADTGVLDAYPLDVAETPEEDGPRFELDWRPMIAAVISDVRRGAAAGEISARFHNALVEAIGPNFEMISKAVGSSGTRIPTKSVFVIQSGIFFFLATIVKGPGSRLHRSSISGSSA